MRVLLLLMLGLLSRVALPYEEGLTTQRRHFSSGGIGDEERAELLADRETHTTWFVFAQKGSGEYYADVQVRITNSSNNKLILDTLAQGPWLFVDLDDGVYKVEAAIGGRPVEKHFSVRFTAKTRYATRHTLYFE